MNDKLETERMIPVNVQPNGWGYYRIEGSEFPEINDTRSNDTDNGELQPTINIEVRSRRHLPRKLIAGVTGFAMLVGAGVYVKEHMPELPQILPKANHELETEIGAPETIVVEDVSINFADIESEFKYKQHTSLDRFGPFNCDTDINQQVDIVGGASLRVDKASITIKKKEATIDVDGQINTRTAHNLKESPINIKGASGSVDVCMPKKYKKDEKITDKERSEMDWAKLISSQTISDAGQVAVACAVVESGESLAEDVIKYNAQVFNDKLTKINPEDIHINFKNSISQESNRIYNQSVAEFYNNYTKISDRYTKATDSHKNVRLNAGALTDCKGHKIKVVKLDKEYNR